MRLTRLSLFASLWLLCVGLVSTAAWYAIDSAGHSTQVLTSASGRSLQPRAASTEPAAAPATDGEASEPGSDDPSGSDDPTADDDPTTSPTQDGPTVSTTSPAAVPDPRRTTSTPPQSRDRTHRSPRPSESSTTTTTDAPPAETQTLLRSTDGGSVTVTCRAQDPIDFVASPAQGWRARTGTRGDYEADVRFSDGDQTWEVHALCVSGQPQASVEHKQSDD